MASTSDIFGDPISDRPKGGRPQHVATPANRDKVTMLLAFGWTNERIARALHITTPTLRARYRSELRYREEARDRLEATLTMTLWRQVENGKCFGLPRVRDDF